MRAEGTSASEQRTVGDDERRAALTRMYGLGVVAWPLFFFVDAIPAVIAGSARQLPWLAALRAIGEVCAISVYFALKYARRLSNWQLTALDAFLFLTGTALLALMGIPLGGIAGRLSQGLLILLLVRCILLPAAWYRAFPIPLAGVIVFPLTLIAAGFFYAPLRAQWRDPASIAAFLHNTLLGFASAAVGVLAGHLLYTARRKLLESTQLGNYRLKARIGTGGVGEVWLARQLSLERDVALKVLREQATRSDATLKRFVREARAASQLRHPNTIRIFDFGATDEGVLFIAMELLTGMDVDNLVGLTGPLPAARVLHIGRQVCGSLAEAHGRGFLHRDIKPANIFVAQLVDEADVVKVLDFGVAHVAATADGDWGGSITEAGALTGTPGYMSPEICSGDVNIDARTDIYSFGAALYFMVTGTPLFPHRTFAEVIMMQVSRMPERPSLRLGGAVPADLEAVIMKCLAKRPGDRYPTIVDVEHALAACADAGAWTKTDARRAWATTHGSSPSGDKAARA